MQKAHTRILFVIEDNRTEGMLLQLALSEIEALDVRIFPTATAMLNSELKPDIVIVDINLPDMNGMELIKRIQEADPNTRIVAVSAQRDIDVVAQVQAQGVYNYLVKSESCLTYLHRVIGELMIVLDYYDQQKANAQNAV
jgi:DNA-binding NtrC family response regulator